MARSGYSTTPPTGGSNIGILFRIDKKDFIDGIKRASAELDRFGSDINKKSQSKSYSITTEVLDLGNNSGSASVTTVRTMQGALDKTTYEWGKKISRLGKQFFRNIIMTAPNRVKPRPGRYETGTMFRSVKGITHETKDYTVSEIGWGGLYYRYFSFQEDGTSNGPSPMKAIPQTSRYLSDAFRGSFSRDLKSKIEGIK